MYLYQMLLHIIIIISLFHCYEPDFLADSILDDVCVDLWTLRWNGACTCSVTGVISTLFSLSCWCRRCRQFHYGRQTLASLPADTLHRRRGPLSVRRPVIVERPLGSSKPRRPSGRAFVMLHRRRPAIAVGEWRRVLSRGVVLRLETFELRVLLMRGRPALRSVGDERAAAAAAAAVRRLGLGVVDSVHGLTGVLPSTVASTGRVGFRVVSGVGSTRRGDEQLRQALLV